MEEQIEQYKSLKLIQRLGICAALGLAYPGYTYWIDYEVLAADLETAIEEETQAVSQQKKAEREVAQLPGLEAEIDKINADLTEARKYLPDHIEFEKILADFGNYERDFEVTITKFVPGEERKPEENVSYREVPLRLEVTASFARIMLFLDKIVHRRDIVHIKGLTMEGEQKKKEAAAAAAAAGGDPVPVEKPEENVKEPAIVKASVDLVFYRKDG